MTEAVLPIPLEALEDCGAILGRRGAGKSGTRTSLLEHELDRGRRCCLIDPKGDSWGIRSNPDGSPSRFQHVYIFGGAHGDHALADTMGAALGELVATHDLSCILDLSSFSVSGMRRFMRDFAEALFEHNRAALTLFVDEADQLAPQRLPAEMAMLLHHMESLVRQGRQRGILMWMLTQRPQILNKNLLSQAESLIAMKMTTPHDRGAIRDWMEAHDPERAKEVEATLAQLAVGEAWVWVPAADFLERVQFPLFSTFDSMRTPRHGEKVEQVRLAPIDTSAIAAALAPRKAGDLPDDTIPGDPKAALEKGRVVGTMLAERDRRIAELEAANAKLRADIAARDEAVEKVVEAIGFFDDAREKAQALLEEACSKLGRSNTSDDDKLPAGEGDSLPAGVASAAEAEVSLASVSSHAPAKGDREGLGAERKPLAVLAGAAPAGLTEASWATLSRYKRTGGTWGTYKSRLRTAGLIEQRGGLWHATAAGVAAAGAEAVPLPRPGPELVARWSEAIPGVSRMLQVLQRRYPHTTTREALAADLNMAASGGTFGTYLSRLRANGLLEEKGKRLRLSPALMGEG